MVVMVQNKDVVNNLYLPTHVLLVPSGDSHVGDVHHLLFDRDHHIDSRSMRQSTRMTNTTDANSRADRVLGESRGSTIPKQEIGREICPPPRKRREIGATEGGTASEPERTSSLQQMPLDILFEVSSPTPSIDTKLTI